MKNVVYITVVLAIFAASCSNKTNLFTKRKYTSGHYFASNHQAPKVKEHIKNNVLKTTSEKPQAVRVNNSAVFAQAAQKEIVTAAVSGKPMEVYKTKNLVANNSVKNDLNHKISKPSIAQVIKAQRSVNKVSHASGSSDNNTILLVILSLFPILALIAVYLHDGRSITLNFWIDLILHITIIGYAIFAILVVLDIVNLA